MLSFVKGYTTRHCASLRRALSLAASSGSTRTFEEVQLEALRNVQNKLLSRTSATAYTALSFFHFYPPAQIASREEKCEDDDALPRLKNRLACLDVKGTIVLSKEGYNGALVVPLTRLVSLYEEMSSVLSKLDFNMGETLEYGLLGQEAPTFPFKKLLVKKKRAALTDRLDEQQSQLSDSSSNDLQEGEAVIDWSDAGAEIDPEDFHNELSSSYSSNEAKQPVLLLDCRNDYESEMGTFKGATKLNTNIFSETFPKLDALLKDVPKDARVLTFCTGGIRCIKVNAYLKQKLKMSNIGRLRKGIIAYEAWLKEVEEEQEGENGHEKSEGESISLFQGTNFLFDRRRKEDDE